MNSKTFFHPDELSAIRDGCDWRRLLSDLDVRPDIRRCTEVEFWGYSPFNPEEKTASFHMRDPGIWYDWSTHAKAPGRDRPGGGVIELVQAIHASRGRIMKLNEAAGWLIERGHCKASEGAAPTPVKDRGEKKNTPIALNLAPKLSQLGTHPEFVARGISEETCRYLRCGYLDAKRGLLAGRIVFQIGGISDDWQSSVILSHMGRATTEVQAEAAKWLLYRTFNPSVELYNLDNLLLDEAAAAQARASGFVVLVEGPFDVAKCVDAGIRNVVASFGSYLTEVQARKLVTALDRLSASRVLLFHDRDHAGRAATESARDLLTRLDVDVAAFDWEQSFDTRRRGRITIPEAIGDPCDLTVEQLRWLIGKQMR